MRAAATLASAMLFPPASKRGYVADTRNATCADPLLLAPGTSWYYGYRVDNPYLSMGCSESGPQTFVPMHWCSGSMDQPVPGYVQSPWLLGFNEPNNKHNCNQEAGRVAREWKTVMQLNPKRQLVSPATAGDGAQFFREFFGNCSQLYGADGCKIKAMAVHSYTCDAKGMHAYLEALHFEFRMPIWLTEFACGDHSAFEPLHRQLSFMREIVPLLDRSKIVHRYAWFSARPKGDPADASGQNQKFDHRGLLVPGKAELSELGRQYISL